MVSLIVLLSPAELTGRFEEAMRAGGASAKVAPVATLSALESVCRDRAGHVRLVAFATDVIVPADVLAALGGPAYNLHPGPPEYPGLFPSCFAIDEGAARFGSTLHEMSERVDEGAIVGVDIFDTPAGIDRLSLDALALASAMRLVAHLAEELADIETPLRPLPVDWSGRRRTAKDFAALCEIPPDISAEDFAHRYRAVGEGPDHALTVVLDGRRFRLAPKATWDRRSTSVVRRFRRANKHAKVASAPAGMRLEETERAAYLGKGHQVYSLYAASWLVFRGYPLATRMNFS